MCLHYDTVFNVGDFYLSTVTFCHSLFKNNPVIPFAFFVHSRKFHEDYLNFFKGIRKRLPILSSKTFIVVTDQEFPLSSVFPSAIHTFCWNHLERDLHYLKTKENCTATEIGYFANQFKLLMNQPSEEKFDLTWENIKSSPYFTSHL